MRLPVVCSIIVHGVMIAAVYRLPASRTSGRDIVEFEIHHPVVPTVPSLTPPVSVEAAPARLATATSTSRRIRDVVEPRLVPLQPMETQPDSATPDPSSSAATVPARKGPVDLTLHGLPSGQWATGPSLAAPGPTKRGPWRPRGDAGDPITGKLVDKKDDYPLESLGRDGFVYNGPQFSAHISLDGSVSFDDKSIRDFKGLSGGFDLTDLVMKGKKEDPYRHEKKRFLEATETKRTEMARRAHEAQIEQSLAELPWHCEEIWHERYRSAAQRRKTLYELWKETAGDGELGQAGAKAREIIEAYIQRVLPASSPDGYTEEELSQLNARSGSKFQPYR